MFSIRADLVPQNADSMYAYSDSDAGLQYWYAKDLLLRILDCLPITNVSDRLDRSDLGNTVIRNDIVYIERTHCFKQLYNISSDASQLV